MHTINIPPAGTRVRFIEDHPNAPFFPPRGTLGTLGHDGSDVPPVYWDNFPGRSADLCRCVDLKRVEVVTAEPAQPALIELATVTVGGRRETLFDGQPNKADIVLEGPALDSDFKPMARVTVDPAVIDRVAVGRQYKLVLVELPEVDKA